MNFKKNFMIGLIFLIVSSVVKSDFKALASYAGDFCLNPITTGALFFGGMYLGKKNNIVGQRIMYVATAMNLVGFLNDVSYIVTSLNEYSNHQFKKIKTTIQMHAEKAAKERKYQVFITGQLLQLGTCAANIFQLYQIRNQYNSKELAFVISATLISTLRLFGCHCMNQLDQTTSDD